MDLVGLQIQRTVLIALVLEALCDLILQPQLLLQFARSGNLGWRTGFLFQPCTHRVVLKLGLVAHQSTIDVG